MGDVSLPDIGTMTFQSGIDSECPMGVEALVYLVHDEIRFPNKEWKGLLYLPIPDHDTGNHDASFPGVPWLDMAVDGVRHFVMQGWPTMIMCRKGKCRSAMVHAAFWMKSAGMNTAQAIVQVSLLAPDTNIRPHFLEGLELYERYLNEHLCSHQLLYTNT